MSPRPLLLLLLSLAACRAAPPESTGTISERRFTSAIVGDDYLLRVRLPPEAAADEQRRFPLVVQLDPTYVGLEEFAITSGLVSQYAAAGDWSQAIVVGIDYDDPYKRERDYGLPKTLTRDFNGDGADRFYRVLRDEILPYLDSALPTDPARRTLVGHSNGGAFAWYATLRHTPDAAPLFSGVVAADCGYHEPLFTLQRWHSEGSMTLPVRLYASRAVYNGAVQAISFDAMVSRVSAAHYQGFEIRTEVLETDHAGAVYPSFEHGLAFILGGGQ